MRGTISPPPEGRREGAALQESMSAPRLFSHTGPTRRSRLVAAAATLAAHLAIFAALFWPWTVSPPKHVPPPPPTLEVSLVDLAKPKLPAPPQPTMLEPASPEGSVRPPQVRISAPVLAASRPLPDNSDLLSESQLAGAAAAGKGGGGACDMARAIQQALRRDPMVRMAVEDAHRLGKAMMLWNGDWVRTGDQDGKGLSAVREAIMWEIAFAPQACRNTRVHGLVLLSLADGSTRFALGSGDWRWSDLLGVHGLSPER